MENINDVIYLSETKDYLQSISDVLRENIKNDFVIICNGSKKIDDVLVLKYIYDCINKAQKKGGDILLGGVQNFQKILQIDENLFCVEKFHGFNFIVFFKSVFHQILNNQESTRTDVGGFLSEIADNIFVMHPFIILEDDFPHVDPYYQTNIVIDDLKHIRKFYK